jgi:hypothetical protein
MHIDSKLGRLVLNHSTHLPGLLPVLRKMLEKSESIKTIVPGRIARVTGHRQLLTLKVTTPTPTGHKVLARHQQTVQEVCFGLSWLTLLPLACLSNTPSHGVANTSISDFRLLSCSCRCSLSRGKASPTSRSLRIV